MVELSKQLHEQAYEQEFEAISQPTPYGLKNTEKHVLLQACLQSLDKLHRAQCEAYGNIAQRFGDGSDYHHLPYLAVRLFKLLTLQSIDDTAVFKVLQSSGTTSQTPARVILDAQTSRRQSKVLVKILQSFIGKERLPMLIIDAPSTVKPGSKFSARAAGIQGLSLFGRRPVFALHDDMSLNVEALQTFCQQYSNQPVLVFGFTFMVWQYFIAELQRRKQPLDLHSGILLHSGGWKKVADKAVSNTVFKQQVTATTGISKIHNFYGMAEQVGSIYVECEHGHLHAPNYAEVVIRDPYTLDVADDGEVGMIQTLSCIPSSYPGHSILTEDLGRVIGRDDCPCGRHGTYFEVLGRLPATEVRGCSDTQS